MNRSPEKQVAAIQMKNTNWAIMVRRDLCDSGMSSVDSTSLQTYSQDNDIVRDYKEGQSGYLNLNLMLSK